MEFKKLLVSSALLAGMMGISANTVSATEKSIADECLNVDEVEIDPGHDVNYKPNQSSEQTTEDSIWLDYPGDGIYAPDPNTGKYPSLDFPSNNKKEPNKESGTIIVGPTTKPGDGENDLDCPGDGAYSPDPEKPIYSSEISEESTSHKDQEIKKENQATSSTQETTKEVQENTPITSKETTKVLSTAKKDKNPSVSTVAIKETTKEGNTTEINEGTLPQTGTEDAAKISAAGAALIVAASLMGYSVFSKKSKNS
ncbi:LPXTG cell wall anchor domain-containing protein [Catellicoccus marimammalium]|uniref:Gram-positive cocci surface proteins LPxTG domain-containing protein n=1 Tax=Catellicoccus marimammalium M35/04/3 TaxID=1234409 RepID=K8ZK77_9ENTE|nr:LPXTG cell wall anchor domain-containing protein [Catellicoccus marimammalium]EKU26993.1 hypothetical protein C683_0989 [Catellicoccus marimammalium M35/04/3]